MSDESSPVGNIKWVDGKNCVVVQMVGDIALQRSEAFQEDLLGVLAAGPGKIVLDLSAVGYMDSSGVASMVKLLARVRRGGVVLRLTGLRPRVRNVFAITRLDTVFEIFPSQQEAMER